MPRGPMPGGPMLRDKAAILARLAAEGVAVERLDHPPVLTVADAARHTAHLPGGHCKNLFLKDKKDRLWLVTCRDDRRTDLNALAKALGAARLSFGRPELLDETLGVRPGAVTPLAIVNDAGGRVTLVLDTGLLARGRVNCHPLENDATVTLGGDDLLRFVRASGHEPVMLDLDALERPAQG